MILSVSRRALRSALVAAASAALLLASSSRQHARADAEGTSSTSFLEADGFTAGGDVTLTVRSPLIGAPVFLTVSSSGAGQTLLGVKAPSVQFRGRITTRGTFRRALNAGSFPSGTSVDVRAVVLGPGRFPHVSNPLHLEFSGATTSFADASSLLPAAASAFETSDVDWADLDGDGWIDAVLGSEGPGAHTLVLMNQAGNGFVEQSATRFPPAAGAATSCVELADVDLDGDVDIFLGGGLDAASPLPNLLLLNDGAGFFSVDGTFPGGAGLALDAEFGDVDGDGDRDLIVANLQDPDHPTELADATVLYRRTSTGYQFDSDLAQLPSNTTHGSGGAITLGDVENDGDLDLFVARAGVGSGPNGSQNLLLLNDGSGDFSDVTAAALPMLQDNTFDASFADFNGDGLLDVFAANSIATNPVAVHLLINQGLVAGTPAFADASVQVPLSFGEATDIRIAVEVADVEGDGDADVFVGIHEFFDSQGGTSGETVLLLNQGGAQGGTQGVFELDPQFSSFGIFVDSDVSVADFDRDGDLDVYIGSTGPFLTPGPPADRLLRNGL